MGVGDEPDMEVGGGAEEADPSSLEVQCGLNKAVLYLHRLKMGSKGACVLFEESWLTPNEFQAISGRETAKDWKRSIKHHGKSLKLLLSKGQLLLGSDPHCRCEECHPEGAEGEADPERCGSGSPRDDEDHQKVDTDDSAELSPADTVSPIPQKIQHPSKHKTFTQSHQTQNICITFVQCWSNVEDVGPTLYKCYTNVLCLLGCWFNVGLTSSKHKTLTQFWCNVGCN